MGINDKGVLMSSNEKIKLTQWLSFGISALGVILKVVKEIIELIPEKGEHL